MAITDPTVIVVPAKFVSAVGSTYQDPFRLTMVNLPGNLLPSCAALINEKIENRLPGVIASGLFGAVTVKLPPLGMSTRPAN